MAKCKNCGNTLILKDGKCIHCGAVHGEKMQMARKEPTKTGLSPVRTFTVNGVSFNMILVEGGSFYYGLDIDILNSEIKSGGDYKKHFPLVQVGSFYIGETPVTQALWEAVMEERDEKIAIWDDKKVIYNPSRFKGKELPVEWMSLYDCNRFFERLNILTTTKFRLPNYYEWEFAAKGGNRSQGYIYSGSDNLNEVAWYRGNSGNSGKRMKRGLFGFIREDVQMKETPGKTHPVKTKKPNELGIYDMSGNVEELVEHPDGYFYYNRGGSWFSTEDGCKIVPPSWLMRQWSGGTYRHSGERGFRLALTPEEMANKIQ